MGNPTLDFQYRLAKSPETDPSEARAIIEFQIRMALETENLKLDRATCERGVHGVFEKPERGTYYVATNPREIIASTLIVSEWSDWRNGEVWWIHSVYVSPEHRGRGVFKGLYAHIRAEAERRPGIRGLRLYVEKKNTVAQAVYRALGMSDEHYQLYEWMKTF